MFWTLELESDEIWNWRFLAMAECVTGTSLTGK